MPDRDAVASSILAYRSTSPGASSVTALTVRIPRAIASTTAGSRDSPEADPGRALTQADLRAVQGLQALAVERGKQGNQGCFGVSDRDTPASKGVPHNDDEKSAWRLPKKGPQVFTGLTFSLKMQADGNTAFRCISVG